MAPGSWEHFGGRSATQQGYRPLENELRQWATAFTPVQAQALLCDAKVYVPSYRKTLAITKELMATAVQHYTKQRKAVPISEQQQMPTVSMLKFVLNPMHLKVQQAFLSSKVIYHSVVGVQLTRAYPAKTVHRAGPEL